MYMMRHYACNVDWCDGGPLYFAPPAGPASAALLIPRHLKNELIWPMPIQPTQISPQTYDRT